jgi:hypothetical protein
VANQGYLVTVPDQLNCRTVRERRDETGRGQLHERGHDIRRYRFRKDDDADVSRKKGENAVAGAEDAEAGIRVRRAFVGGRATEWVLGVPLDDFVHPDPCGDGAVGAVTGREHHG